MGKQSKVLAARFFVFGWGGVGGGRDVRHKLNTTDFETKLCERLNVGPKTSKTYEYYFIFCGLLDENKNNTWVKMTVGTRSFVRLGAILDLVET